MVVHLHRGKTLVSWTLFLCGSTRSLVRVACDAAEVGHLHHGKTPASGAFGATRSLCAAFWLPFGHLWCAMQPGRGGAAVVGALGPRQHAGERADGLRGSS